MEQLTYHQVLADMYEDTAKNVLAHTTEPETEENIPPPDKYPDELENQEEFQKQQPSHYSTPFMQNPTNYADKTKLSVQYDKHVKHHVINIDSRFRNFYSGLPPSSTTSSSTDFIYNLPIPIKNAISIRLSSIEIPNVFYTFSESRGNTSFHIVIPSGSTNPLNKRLIKINEGNYDDLELCSEVETLLNNAVNSIIMNSGGDPIIPGTTFSVLVDGGNATTPSPFYYSTGKVTISTVSSPFDLILDSGTYGDREFDYGLGHYLGFKQKNLTGGNSYVANSVIDTTDWPYVFLSLNKDWKIIIHQNATSNSIYAFSSYSGNCH